RSDVRAGWAWGYVCRDESRDEARHQPPRRGLPRAGGGLLGACHDMIRAALLAILLLTGPARAEEAGALRTEQGVVARDGSAAGALVWLHPHYTDGPPPAAPPFTARMQALGWDLWRY